MTPPCQHAPPVDGCRLCHLAATRADYRRLWGIDGVPGPAVPAARRPANRGRCLHVGKRLEFRAGCSGWLCRHECEAGEPEAVPGGVCQTCPKWEGE